MQLKDLNITPESVLRGQGADPEIIKSRRPELFTIAQQALQEGRALLEPKVLTRQLAVKSLRHEKLELEGNFFLSGPMVTTHLRSAQSVFAVICTVGSEVHKYASSAMENNLVLGLAIDGVGSAAVEALANAVCRDIEFQVGASGLQTTIPLSPGMVGWPVEDGQPILFEILDPAQIGVELTPHKLMIPQKTLSMLIGVGSDFDTSASTCDYCAMRETCRYQDHYNNIQG